MAEKKMCPHCGSQMFMVKTIRAGLAEFTTDPNEPCKILKESKDKFDIEIVGCARCKTSVTEAELVEGVKCSKCGRIVGPMDINAEGICNVCEAVQQRAELANASKEDLIKMLLDAEKKANPVASKIAKQIDKAENTDAAITTVATESVPQDDSSDATEEKKPRRRRKKKDDDTATDESVNAEEDAEEVEETTETADVNTEVAVEEVANQQEAPFPDIAMNLPEAPEVSEPITTTVPDEQPVGADFRMFEDGEEPF